jgi:hypothetical protein
LTKIETVLIYAGIPALVIAVVVGLVFAGDARRGGGKRYRPGRPYDFHPVWFLASSTESAAPGTGRAALGGAPSRAALTGQTPPGPLLAQATDANEWPAGDPTRQNATGGASDRW